MRKRIISQDPQNVVPADQAWLDLQSLAEVELTSEDQANPIEAALVSGAGLGWRAAQAGEQTIRLWFDESQRVRRIQVLFHEDQKARTQSLCCGGRRMAVNLTGRLCVSNTTSAHQV
jgi:hypothetical protein